MCNSRPKGELNASMSPLDAATKKAALRLLFFMTENGMILAEVQVLA
jgi:hypothetical protein